jgi:hypothetical protein
MTPQELATALGKARREGGEWRSLCPAHADHDPSLSITERDGRLYFVCRAGCSQGAVMDALKARGLWGQRKERGGNLGEIAETYDYVDERGKLLFEVVRFANPKGFRQRRPDGVGGWVNDLNGVRRVPYHLDLLVKAARAGKGWRVYIVEGEKDADKLIGRWDVTATTNPMGAGKWRDEYNRYFADAEVIIIPDNDDAGREHAKHVADELVEVAQSVRIVHLQGVPDKGDISDWIADGGTQSNLEDIVDDTTAFCSPVAPDGQPEVKWAGDDEDEDLPPREWLLGTNFCKGFLSGLTGSGGTGKTAIRLLQLIALALGRSDLTKEHVFIRTRVLLVCLEDNEIELRRRIRAACRHHGIDPKELHGWLAYWTPKDLKFLQMTQFGQAEEGGLATALRRIIKKLGIGLVCIDPFVKSHSANENDNVLVDRAVTLFLHVAHECGCACDYVHHHKKGLQLAGDKDAGRGASSLADASRLVKTAITMTEKEAEEFGVKDHDRKFLIRLDDAKINIAPPAAEAVWFKLVGVNIGNATETYPKGDNIQSVERWYPPSFDLHKSHIITIFNAIRRGPEPDERYSGNPKSDDWAATLIQEITGCTETRAERLLNDWIKNSVLIESKYYSKKRKRQAPGLTLNEGKAATMLGSLYDPPNEENPNVFK